MSSYIDLMCQEVVELVTDYLAGALAAETMVRFEKHLLTCPPCTTYLEQMKTTLELAGGLSGPAPAPDDVERELLQLFRRWHGR